MNDIDRIRCCVVSMNKLVNMHLENLYDLANETRIGTFSCFGSKRLCCKLKAILQHPADFGEFCTNVYNTCRRNSIKVQDTVCIPSYTIIAGISITQAIKHLCLSFISCGTSMRMTSRLDFGAGDFLSAVAVTIIGQNCVIIFGD